MNICLAPLCDNLIDGDEPFCSVACEQAYLVWDADQRDFYDDEHHPHWNELGVS